MNTEKLKGTWEKVKTAAKKVSKKVWIVAAVVVAALIIGVVIFQNTRPYVTLFSGMSSSDTAAVMSLMEDWGVKDYRIVNGDTIRVRSNMEDTLRARVLQEGYPSQGFSFSYDDTYYNKISALSTEAERKNAWLITVMEKMAATIRCFDNVMDATVSITSSGSDQLYVGSSTTTPTASVTVTMLNGRTLTDKQVNGIRQMVANGVEGMTIEDVAIGDTAGNVYTNGSGSGVYDSEASALKIQLEKEYASKLESQIMQHLIPMYGVGNVVATVNCVVDLGYSTIDSHEVQLPSWAQDGSTLGAGTIGTIIWNGSFTLNPDGTVGGLVGTNTNSDILQYMEDLTDPANGAQQFDISGQTVMDNTTVDTHTIRSAAYISDCTVTVTINSTTAGLVDTDVVRNHVASAAGISAVATETLTAEEYLDSKISVVAQPFYVETPVGPDGEPMETTDNTWFGIPQWIILAAAAGLLLFIILLVVILLVAGKRRKKKERLRQEMLRSEEERNTAELLASMGLPPDIESAGADVMSLELERSIELRQEIRQFVDENPEVAAKLLGAWIKGDDEDA